MLDMEPVQRILPDWGARDQLSELQQQIDQMHYSYLETDDSPQKIEQRQKLEGFIREYLCLVPHSRKFNLRETLEVLHKSAASHENFSGYRAALAWNAIARYAANLLTQPWRKEYKEIKLYCGFYKHEIEENLIGADLMFEAMGYKRVDQSSLILEGPICPDQVTNVSRDALVAVVECQLLKTVWENVSAVCSVQWLEALQFREMHIGGPEQACRALLYRHNERNYQQQKQEAARTCYATNGIEAGLHPYHQMCNSNTANNLMAQNMHLPLHPELPGQCLYGQFRPQNAYPMNYYNYQPTYAPIATAIPVNMPNVIGIPVQYPMQNYAISNYINQNKPCPTYGHGDLNVTLQTLPKLNGFLGQSTVVTGQLIEVDGTQHQHSLGSSHYPHRHRKDSLEDEVDSRLNKFEAISLKSNECRIEKLNNNKQDKTKDGVKSDESFENWDYVYRDLEKQGYNKDLGDRENVLEKNLRKEQQNIARLENTFNSLSVQKSNVDNEINNRNKTNTLTNNDKNIHDKSKNSCKSKTDTLKRDTLKKQLPAQNIDKTPNKLCTKKTVLDHWQCAACTFNNPNERDICEMCGKSRKVGSEITPLTSGGKECSKCTLVNGRDVKICGACGASLQDSPTYI